MGSRRQQQLRLGGDTCSVSKHRSDLVTSKSRAGPGRNAHRLSQWGFGKGASRGGSGLPSAHVGEPLGSEVRRFRRRGESEPCGDAATGEENRGTAVSGADLLPARANPGPGGTEAVCWAAQVPLPPLEELLPPAVRASAGTSDRKLGRGDAAATRPSLSSGSVNGRGPVERRAARWAFLLGRWEP